MHKPRLFVASSVENLETAYAVQENLEYKAEITVWSQGVFKLTKSALANLLREKSTYDFAVFVFSPDDIVDIRNEKVSTTRDNVVFELGIFISALGEDRTFVLKPRDIELHLPTDLAGITPATYDPNRSDNNLQAALGPATTKISRAIDALGVRNPIKQESNLNTLTTSKHFYQILNKASDKAIDVKSYSDKDGGLIHLYTPHKYENQVWEIRPWRLNLFSIISLHSNKCMEVKNSSHNNSALIQQNAFTGDDNQLWQIVSNSDGSYFIMPNHSHDKYLEQDAQTIGVEPAGKLIQHAYFSHLNHERNHQKWIFKEVFPKIKVR